MDWEPDFLTSITSVTNLALILFVDLDSVELERIFSCLQLWMIPDDIRLLVYCDDILPAFGGRRQLVTIKCNEATTARERLITSHATRLAASVPPSSEFFMLTRNNVFLERVSQELRSFGRKAQAPIFNGSIRPGLEIPMFFVSRLDDIHAASVTKGWRKAVAHLFLKRNLFSEQPWITTANYLQTECDLDASILPHVLNILLSFGILSGVKNTEDCSSDQIRYTVTEDVLTKVVEKSGHRLNEAFGNNVSSDKNRRNLQSFLSEYLATLSAPSYETEIRTERSFHALSLRKDFTKPIYQSSLNMFELGFRSTNAFSSPDDAEEAVAGLALSFLSNYARAAITGQIPTIVPNALAGGSSGESSEEGEVSDVEGVTPIFPAKSVAIKALGQWAMKNKQSIEYEFEQFPQVGFRAKLSFMQDNARIEFVSASQHSRKVAAKEEVAKLACIHLNINLDGKLEGAKPSAAVKSHIASLNEYCQRLRSPMKTETSNVAPFTCTLTIGGRQWVSDGSYPSKAAAKSSAAARAFKDLFKTSR